jgi:asparagine synthase (glutamine-hydrolysing)
VCGIAGFQAEASGRDRAADLERLMTTIAHRGPDGQGGWLSGDGRVGLGHRRLSIIDLSPSAAQPMRSPGGNVITYNGEIYNYIELGAELGGDFKTASDTEVILRAYEKWGERCVEKLRGMFAFALWDAALGRLFVARDRFGIKPLYYATVAGTFYFASEIKALLPFLSEVRPEWDGLHDYFCFQFCLGGKTMFEGVRQLEPAHCGYVGADGRLTAKRYWEVHYDLDWAHDERYFVEQVRERLFESVDIHLRADVEVGAYVSGGTDSSIVASIARRQRRGNRYQAFTGKFSEFGDAFDESRYVRELAAERGMRLHEVDITEQDFARHMSDVIYHLDQPVAGPGSFPQYLVSRLVKGNVKVVLGGQGGDEVFGGYARYLLAYWEQCIKGALDGTMNSGNFVVTYQSIIPNLISLRNYKPLIQEFWSEGIFEERDRRYFRLINRSNTFGDIIEWGHFKGAFSFEEFRDIYWGRNVGKESYFDSMTHFDFKTLLPALLQVEDRMSMAHGVESRVPLLDHPLVELAATIPANIKFKNGELKRLLKIAFPDQLPKTLLERKDKMGFPVPLQPWMKRDGPARQFVFDTMRSERARKRFYFSRPFDVEALLAREGPFSRNLWAFLSLELWQRRFFDSPAR